FLRGHRQPRPSAHRPHRVVASGGLVAAACGPGHASLRLIFAMCAHLTRSGRIQRAGSVQAIMTELALWKQED
ncbi:MAG: hypothetical protein PHS80_10725, partial [Methanothrix sp.]|nr:hypothetical protein [Methanothrix sp.]